MDVLKSIYKSEDNLILDYTIPALIVIIFIVIITKYYIQTSLNESKVDWSTNKCIPKYMFVSGFIKNKPGKNSLESTYDNFSDCVKQHRVEPLVKPDPSTVTFDSWNIFKSKPPSNIFMLPSLF